MDLQSWAAFAAILAALVANFAMTSRKFDKLDTKIDGVEARLDSKIDRLGSRLDSKIDGVEAKLDGKIDSVRNELRDEMTAGFTRVDARLAMIEQRTFDISLRLPPAAPVAPAEVAREA